MKRQKAGYTILEAMIFLAVTGVLFALIYPNYANRQDKVKFSQSVRDLESKINDVMNDVSTGYFPSGNVSCTIGGGGAINLTSGGTEQGTRSNCIFVGKVIHFNGGTDAKMNTFTLVGKRQSGGADVTDLTAATPTAVAPTPATGSIPNLTDVYTIRWGMEINKIIVPNSGPLITTGSVGIMSVLGTSASDSAKKLDIFAVNGPTLTSNNISAAGLINLATWAPGPRKNPSEGVLICIRDPKSDDRAAILIGGQAGVGKTKSFFDSSNIDSAFGTNTCT